MCHYSKSTKGHAEVVASTCRTAVDGVATAFIAADEPDPRLDSDGKTLFLLLPQFKGYKKNNPARCKGPYSQPRGSGLEFESQRT